eukprot:scaffold14074_cov111-Isochrysis_galbana.AAC.7
MAPAAEPFPALSCMTKLPLSALSQVAIPGCSAEPTAAPTPGWAAASGVSDGGEPPDECRRPSAQSAGRASASEDGCIP